MVGEKHGRTWDSGCEKRQPNRVRGRQRARKILGNERSRSYPVCFFLVRVDKRALAVSLSGDSRTGRTARDPGEGPGMVRGPFNQSKDGNVVVPGTLFKDAINTSVRSK